MQPSTNNQPATSQLTLLPSYALYIRQQQLKPFVSYQLQLLQNSNAPGLSIPGKSKEEIREVITIWSEQILAYLEHETQNDIKVAPLFIWQDQALPTEDFTHLLYIQKSALIHFIPGYITEPEKIISLINEIDWVQLQFQNEARQSNGQTLQQQLADQSHLTNKIIDTIPGLVYLFNCKTFSIEFVNERAVEFFNISVKELKELRDNDIFKYIHPDDLPATLDWLHQFETARDGEVRQIEYRLRQLNGEYVWMRNYMTVFKAGADGKPLLTIGNILNIDTEKKTEEQLLEAQEVAGMGSFDCDVNFQQANVSKQVYNILELDETFNWNQFLQRVHPDDQKKLTTTIDTAISKLDGFECEYRYEGKQGEKIIWSRGKVLQENGKPVTIRGTIFDVTERYQMLEQLRQSEELYMQAQAISHIGHFTLNLDTSKIRFTDELNRIYGFDTNQHEFDYNDIIKMRDAEDHSNVREKLKHTIITGEPFDFYFRIITKQGVRKNLHALGKGLYDDEGKMVQLVGTIQDVTERQQLIQQLQKNEWLHKQGEVLVNMGNWFWNVKENKLEWSDQLYKIYGLEPTEDITIERFLSLIHPQDKPAIEQEIKSGYPHDYVDSTFRIITPQGVEKTLRSIAQVQRGKDQRIISVMGSEQDITEHQRLISQLQESEALYKQSQSLAHVGNWSWDIDKNIVGWSDELYKIYGLEPQREKITYETYLSFVHPEDVEQVKEKVTKALETGEAWSAVHRIVWRDGSLHYVVATGELIQKPNRPALLVGTSQDITRQQEFERQLNEQQNFIKKIADASPAIIAAYNVQSGQYIFINQGLKKLLGYDAQEALEGGINFFVSLVHPDDLPLIMKKNADTIQQFNTPEFQNINDVIVDFEYRMKHINGGWRWFHTFGTVFGRNAKGEIEHILNITLDITDRMQAEIRLAEQEHFIKQIADASPTILYLFDVESNKFIYINREVFFVLGYTTDEILNFESSANQLMYHPEDFHLLPERKGSNKKFQQMNSMIQYECRMKHKNDGWCWLLVREIAFKADEQGNVLQVLGAALDINQRKEMERSLLYNSFQLEQSNASLEEFAYVASHDLKEPLRKISTFGDRLITTQIDNLTGDGKIYLKKIVDASQRMQTMISDLLSISMISGNRSFETYSLQKILEDVLQTLEFKIEQKNAVIQSDPLPEANIIPSQFRQLFQNLLSNSLKFVNDDTKPVITIKHQLLAADALKDIQLTEAKQYHKIELIDNGIGFENEYAGKIFAIFQRLHGRSEYEGTGIGLAICKKIVEHHGGVIYATGVPDEGANFTIILPA